MFVVGPSQCTNTQWQNAPLAAGVSEPRCILAKAPAQILLFRDFQSFAAGLQGPLPKLMQHHKAKQSQWQGQGLHAIGHIHDLQEKRANLP